VGILKKIFERLQTK